MTRSPLRLAELAVRFGCELRGDPEALVDRVATLQAAGPGTLAFLANPRYKRYLATTAATAVVLDATAADDCPTAALVAANPYASFARIAAVLHAPPPPSPGVHPSAVVEAGASIAPDACIGALAYIGAGARIGARVQVGPGCMLAAGVVLGEDTVLVARVTLCRDVVIGARCLLHPGVVIGADGFGQAPDTDGYVKVPQIGGVRLGDDVEVGANTTIDRGAIGDTIIELGVKIDNLVQIGHNCRIGAHTVIAGCAGIAGSTIVGQRCMIAGQAGIVGHLEIADDVVITGKTMVSASIRKAGVYSSGMPADDARRFRRNVARFRQLDEIVRRLRRTGVNDPAVGEDE